MLAVDAPEDHSLQGVSAPRPAPKLPGWAAGMFRAPVHGLAALSSRNLNDDITSLNIFSARWVLRWEAMLAVNAAEGQPLQGRLAPWPALKLPGTFRAPVLGLTALHDAWRSLLAP